MIVPCMQTLFTWLHLSVAKHANNEQPYDLKQGNHRWKCVHYSQYVPNYTLALIHLC